MKLKTFLFASIFLLLFCFGQGVNAAYSSSYQEPTRLLKLNSRGEDVKWLQDMLNHNGYVLSVDGIFGNNTYKAVRQFQSNSNISIDGIVGTQTRKKIKQSAQNIKNVNAYMYTDANVNFRSGASTKYTSYGVINKNTQVYVINKRDDGWSYVKYNNKYGYIYSKYLTTNSNNLPAFQRTNTSLVEIIKNCKKYYANNNFYYSLAPGVRSIPADKSKTYDGKRYVDCSSFTSWVLYEYALINGKTSMQNYFSSQRTSSTFANIGANGGNNYLKVIDKKTSNKNVDLSKAQVGDILVSNGHVEFYNSYTLNSNGSVNLKVYNCGSNASVKNSGITTSATKYPSEIIYILRVK